MKTGNRTKLSELQAIAKTIRKDVIRMVARHGQGYVQQGLGATDLFTHLFFRNSVSTAIILNGQTETGSYCQRHITQQFITAPSPELD